MVDSANTRHSRNRVDEVWTEGTAQELTGATVRMKQFVSTGAITLQRRFTTVGRPLVNSSALLTMLKESNLREGFRKCVS